MTMDLNDTEYNVFMLTSDLIL